MASFWRAQLGRSRLPVVLAAEAAECGLACMTMVAGYHGHDVDLNGLRQRYSMSLQGTTLRGLIAMADGLSLGTRALRVDMSDLVDVPTPAILHWDLNHFVVLKSASGKQIQIHDPSSGARTLSLAEASKHFTGVLLELVPTQGFQPVSQRAPIRLSGLWSRMSGLSSALAQVLALSLALQIAVFAAPFYLQLVVDDAVLHADRDLLMVLALGFGALILVQAAIEALRSWALRVFGQQMAFQVVGNLVRHMLRLRADFFEKRHVGDILSRLGSVQPIQDAVTRGAVAAIIDGMMALAAACILFFYSALLASIVLASVAIALIANLLLYPAMRARMEEEIIAKARESSHLIESVRAATTVKLMGREAEREGVWRNLYADVVNAGLSVGKYTISLQFIQTAAIGIQTVLVTYLAARMIIKGDGFSLGMLFSFLSFRQTFTDRAVGLISQAMQFRLLRLHLERLADIVTADPDVQTAALGPVEVGGAMRMKDVWFRYGESDAFVLEGVDFEIQPGEFVAITGPSGSGKTTLMKLLLGLTRPTQGFIELDGHRATPQYWQAWRAGVGVVVQDDKLLSGSIADNIAFFDPDLDMARVHRAAAHAQVHDDIMRSPMQYLTLVGDMGSTLSAGQRQRVLLARALYREPKVLLLDEGTANLDEQTEEAIADLVASLPITRIVVAHRPALIRRAQRVLRMRARKLNVAEAVG